MIEPIILNNIGEAFVPPLNDEAIIFNASGFMFKKIGEHTCGNFTIWLSEISPDWNLLACREMVLRMPIPASVNSYGKLRQYLAEQIELQESNLAKGNAILEILKSRANATR